MSSRSNVTPARWLQLMADWSFTPNHETYGSLVANYSESSRHYHSVEHISACLGHLDTCVNQIVEPREVELALWFHDAIYKPLSGGNERKSADWAALFLKGNGATRAQTDRIHRLIMATEHDKAAESPDESIRVDIDLSILGADPDIYEIFEQAIRKEYWLVPRAIYCRKRAELLRMFLDRPRIYQNNPFFEEREQQARANLSNAVLRLSGCTG